MHVIQQYINSLLDRFPTPGKYLIAFSGGCDSMVLLHAIHNYIDSDRLLAIHVNHGLQSGSDAWEHFCKLQADKLNIAFQSCSANLKGVSSNIEEQARKHRYRLFAEQMNENDLLLTAHHMDDQAETLLLQLLRGAGVEGLSAMSEISDFEKGRLFRPLLNFSRSELEAYAREFNLSWVDDPSNTDNRYDRNYLRHEIIPLLEKRWPAARSSLSRSALNCREAAELVHVQANEDLLACRDKLAHMLSIEHLETFSPARRHFVVRSWLQSQQLAIPDRDKIERICTDLIEAREDARPVISWAGVELHRFKDYLFLLKPADCCMPDEIFFSHEDLKEGYLELSTPAGKLFFDVPDTASVNAIADKLAVKFRRQGQEIEIHNRQGTRKLKKLFQEWGIPPWMRDSVPMVYFNGKCQAIADFAYCVPQDEIVLKNLKWMPAAGFEWR